MRVTKHLSVIVLLALAMLLGPIGSARAVPITFELTNSNVSQLDASDDTILVTVDIDGTNTTVQLQWVGGAPDTVGAIGFQQFYYDCERVRNPSPGECNFSNANDTETSAGRIRDVDAGDVTQHIGNTGAGGGFGAFNSHKNNLTGGMNLDLTFTLDGLADLVGGSDFTTLGGSGTNQDWWMAVQVKYANGCSGWFSNRSTDSVDSDSSCVAVPEPSSVALLSIALFGLAGFAIWRRRRAFMRTG